MLAVYTHPHPHIFHDTVLNYLSAGTTLPCFNARDGRVHRHVLNYIGSMTEGLYLESVSDFKKRSRYSD
jgi:hypothetical protein